MADTNRPCIVCDKKNAKACSRCKSISYCSVPCQRSDWRTHKLLCAECSSFDKLSRPAPPDKHFLAIFFPVDDDKPKLVWIRRGREGSNYPLLDVNPFLKLPLKESSGHDCIHYNPLKNKRTMSDMIYLHYRDNFFNDGSELNKCLYRIASLRPGAYRLWRGPMIAYVKVGLDPGLDLDLIQYRDITMADFKNLTDYLFWYHYGETKVPKLTCHEFKFV